MSCNCELISGNSERKSLNCEIKSILYVCVCACVCLCIYICILIGLIDLTALIFFIPRQNEASMLMALHKDTNVTNIKLRILIGSILHSPSENWPLSEHDWHKHPF